MKKTQPDAAERIAWDAFPDHPKDAIQRHRLFTRIRRAIRAATLAERDRCVVIASQHMARAVLEGDTDLSVISNAIIRDITAPTRRRRK